MGDPVTQGQFFEAVQQLQDKIDAKHTSMREYVGQRADKLEAVIERHADDDTSRFKAVTDRLLIIETERAGEKSQAMKRATVVGILTAGGITSLIEAMKVWLSK